MVNMNQVNTSTNNAIELSMQTLLNESGLRSMKIGRKTLLPIAQGGMGVGISAHKLAGSVASFGGIGTISSIDLRRLHPDLMAKTDHLPPSDKTKAVINEANLIALEREIKATQQISRGHGMVAVNVMRAVSEYAPYITKALQCGIEAVVVGAGLPLDLPDLAKDYPNVNLIPILADARGLQLIVKKWERKGRLPNAIVLEHPRLAGGHLGAATIQDLNDPKYDFERSIPQSLEFLKNAGLENKIPIIAAGGITSLEDIKRVQSYGAAGVQMGTAFAVTHESGAHPNFKKTLAEAKLEDIVEFISVAGLPARAIKTPWLIKYLETEPKLKSVAHKKEHCTLSFDCLIECGLRDGNAAVGQFCIDKHLAFALEGDLKKGLFFRGSGKLPFGSEIKTVRELITFLLSGRIL